MSSRPLPPMILNLKFLYRHESCEKRFNEKLATLPWWTADRCCDEPVLVGRPFLAQQLLKGQNPAQKLAIKSNIKSVEYLAERTSFILIYRLWTFRMSCTRIINKIQCISFEKHIFSLKIWTIWYIKFQIRWTKIRKMLCFYHENSE